MTGQPEPEPTAICDLCAQPIDPHDGYLWISHAEVSRVERHVVAWESGHPSSEPMTGDNLMTRPQPARWRVTHTACEPGRPEDRYDIALDRILSFRDLAGWTIHLMRKTWLRHTDQTPDRCPNALAGDSRRHM